MIIITTIIPLLMLHVVYYYKNYTLKKEFNNQILLHRYLIINMSKYMVSVKKISNKINNNESQDINIKDTQTNKNTTVKKIATKDTKDSKDTKNTKVIKNTKDTKDTKDTTKNTNNIKDITKNSNLIKNTNVIKNTNTNTKDTTKDTTKDKTNTTKLAITKITNNKNTTAVVETKGLKLIKTAVTKPLIKTETKPLTKNSKIIKKSGENVGKKDQEDVVESEKIDKWLNQNPDSNSNKKTKTNNDNNENNNNANSNNKNSDNNINDKVAITDDLYQNNNNSNDLIQQPIKPRKRELGMGKRADNSNNSNNSNNSSNNNSIGNDINNEISDNDSNKPKSLQDLMLNNSQLINDCINIISEADPDQVCSKDELIARIQYQRNLQMKQNGNVKTKMIIAMEKILSDLRNEQIDEGVKTMNTTRKEQDKIVLSNEMDEKVYKMKIDLTLPENKRNKGDDPHSIVFKESKKWWGNESKKIYVAPPKVEAAFKKDRGNKALPKDIAKQLGI